MPLQVSGCRVLQRQDCTAAYVSPANECTKEAVVHVAGFDGMYNLCALRTGARSEQVLPGRCCNIFSLLTCMLDVAAAAAAAALHEGVVRFGISPCAIAFGLATPESSSCIQQVHTTSRSLTADPGFQARCKGSAQDSVCTQLRNTNSHSQPCLKDTKPWHSFCYTAAESCKGGGAPTGSQAAAS